MSLRGELTNKNVPIDIRYKAKYCTDNELILLKRELEVLRENLLDKRKIINDVINNCNKENVALSVSIERCISKYGCFDNYDFDFFDKKSKDKEWK